MICAGVTSGGRACRNRALAGDSYCRVHLSYGMGGDSFYGVDFDPEELRALAVASTLEGVDSELALLRVLVRKCVQVGDVDAVRRAVEAVGRLVKLRHDLTGGQVDQLQGALGRVLDTLGQELGQPL